MDAPVSATGTAPAKWDQPHYHGQTECSNRIFKPQVLREIIMPMALRWLSVVLIQTTLVASATAQAAGTPALSRAQALQALEQPAPSVRRAGVERLAEIGTMKDADQVAMRLHDPDEQVREVATTSMWQIWSRSGDKTIDAEYQKGVQLMGAGRIGEGLAVFSAIIKKRPEFAEAWNKRATLYFLVGEFDLSLKDCDEVMKRNPHHFGALSGYGQIYLQMGDLERSLGYFERALKVNPGLTGVAATIEALQRQLGNKRRSTI
jgi:tetratricopeptide (TPR) repeat protein